MQTETSYQSSFVITKAVIHPPTSTKIGRGQKTSSSVPRYEIPYDRAWLNKTGDKAEGIAVQQSFLCAAVSVLVIHGCVQMRLDCFCC